jgi:membrane protein implicated in regulation of membrane protease activity
MISVDVANAVFLVCLVAGAILLLISLVLDDELADLARTLRLRRGDDVMPVLTYLFAFLAAFGLGGLLGTRILSAEPAPAVAFAFVAGLMGVGVTLALYGVRERRRETVRSLIDLDDYVGHRGRVTSAITAGGQGTVSVQRANFEREFVATSETDLSEGTSIVVRDVDETASTLVVTPTSHSYE